jgi:hypothetical protein
MLTAWFELNRTNLASRNLLYTEIPNQYVWKNDQRVWVERQRHQNNLLCRIYSISPRQGELFFLRVLLLHVRGAQSFEDLRSYNGVVYDTFKGACFARGLIEDDQLWLRTLEEAVTFQMPVQLRHLFVTILINANLINPREIFERFKEDFYQDFFYHHQNPQLATELCLADIERLLNMQGKSCIDYGLEVYRSVLIANDGTRLTPAQNRDLAERNIRVLNREQLLIFNTIVEAVVNNHHLQNNCFYIDGPAGTGKTFLLQVILN